MDLEPESDWTRPPFFARPPRRAVPLPTFDSAAGDFASFREIVDNELGSHVDLLASTGVPPAAICEILYRDHGVAVAPEGIERYMLHVQIVKRSMGRRRVDHPELDDAIRGRQDELAREAPEDLQRLDDVIHFVHGVAMGRDASLKATAGLPTAPPVTEDGPPPLDPNVVLRERVKAAATTGKLLEQKYNLTKRTLGGEQKTETVSFEMLIRAAFGPAAKIMPKMEKEDPLGLLGKPGR